MPLWLRISATSCSVPPGSTSTVGGPIASTPGARSVITTGSAATGCACGGGGPCGTTGGCCGM